MFALVKADNEINLPYINKLEDGWDWPVGKAKSLQEFINLKANRRISYWLLFHGEPAGVVSFSEHKDYGKTQIGYFLHPDYRSQGFLEVIINSAIVMFDALNVELIASVDINNVRSVKALQKIIKVQPVKYFEFSYNRDALMFVLTDDKKENNKTYEGIINVLINDDVFLRSLKR